MITRLFFRIAAFFAGLGILMKIAGFVLVIALAIIIWLAL